jgi:hypothetical protein
MPRKNHPHAGGSDGKLRIGDSKCVNRELTNAFNVSRFNWFEVFPPVPLRPFVISCDFCPLISDILLSGLRCGTTPNNESEDLLP